MTGTRKRKDKEAAMRMRGSAWTGAILAGLMAWSAADAVAG